jgi:hypothetical protein
VSANEGLNIMDQTHPNATSPPINRDRDEVKGDQISSIGDELTEALKSKLTSPRRLSLNLGDNGRLAPVEAVR